MSVAFTHADGRAFALLPAEKIRIGLACAGVIIAFAVYYATPAAFATQALPATGPYATFVDGAEGEPPPWPIASPPPKP